MRGGIRHARAFQLSEQGKHMGDKGGKKDKSKTQKQSADKKKQKDQKQKDRQATRKT
jgi:hypothetical protein